MGERRAVTHLSERIYEMLFDESEERACHDISE